MARFAIKARFVLQYEHGMRPEMLDVLARLQLSPRCGDNLGTVLRSLPREYLRADTVPDLPIGGL